METNIRIDLSIVIPSYNDITAAKSAPFFVMEYIDNNCPFINDYEIIVVDDGSTDGTYEALRRIYADNERVSVIRYDENQGKGYAVRRGIRRAQYDNVCFMDADLSVSLDVLRNTIDMLSKNTYDMPKHYVAIGSRKLGNSKFGHKQGKLRQIMSNLCIKFVNHQLHLSVSDSQCGFKMFDKATAKTLAHNQTIFRWAFDVEYLYLAKLLRVPIIEVPVYWSEPGYKKGTSLVRPLSATIGFMKDVRKVKKVHRHRHISFDT